MAALPILTGNEARGFAVVLIAKIGDILYEAVMFRRDFFYKLVSVLFQAICRGFK